MWIKQLPNNYHKHKSFSYGSVLLWQNKKIYVMDNHLSAAWCWLQHCNPNQKYNFMHIDRHYDMLSCFDEIDLQPLRNNPHMPYNDFTNLKCRNNRAGMEFNVFRWDNYIMAAYILRPDWFHTNIFLTHKEGQIGKCKWHDTLNINEENPLYMDSIIEQYIGEPSHCLSLFQDNDHLLPWIVNLDLDVFYTIQSPRIQLYSDDYIRFISKLLNKNMRNIQVLTIALSPDCIGGDDIKKQWDNSFNILKIMSEEIDYLKEFPFPNI